MERLRVKKRLHVERLRARRDFVEETSCGETSYKRLRVRRDFVWRDFV